MNYVRLLVLTLLLLIRSQADGQAVPHTPNFDPAKDYKWPDLAANGSRISVGFQASVGQFPSIVAISLPGALCAGTLISPYHVLTAAHCLYPWAKSEITSISKLYVGLTDRNKMAACKTNTCQTRTIRNYAIHPSYNPDNSITTGDIGIITMSSPVTTIKPSRISKTRPPTGKEQYIAGWGIVAASLQTAYQLMYTQVAPVKSRKCMFKPIFFDAKASVCAVSVGEWANNYTASACQGDSGGPLIDTKSNRLYGVISYGILENDTDPCGTYIRTVFMSTAYYYDWIIAKMKMLPSPPPPVKRKSPPPPSKHKKPPPPAKRKAPPPPKKNG